MVNINDFPEASEHLKKLTGGEDMLAKIFDRQRELMEKYRDIESETLPHVVPAFIPVDLNSYLGQDQVKQRLFWTIVEISEVIDCLKNKPWKQTMIETDINHFKEEMADALHFFVEACIIAGIDADELFSLYMRKSEVNKFRQRSKY